jgi:hypothetical protein
VGHSMEGGFQTIDTWHSLSGKGIIVSFRL